jgi:hypothetical protein
MASYIERHQAVLRPLLPSHARERDHGSRKWSVTWSDSRNVWTVAVVDPQMSTWYVKVSSDSSSADDYGLTRTAHMEAIEPSGLLLVLEGFGALPYHEPGEAAPAEAGGAS